MSNRIGDELRDSAEVAQDLNIHRVTLWKWVKSGRFPPPDIRSGRKFRRWRSSTVAKWKEAMR